MANTIQIKRKTTSGAPTIGSLSDGEMCLVVPDSALYQRVDGSTLILLNGKLSDAEVETAALNQGFLKAQVITQSAYDLLSPPDANTIYLIEATTAIFTGANVLDPINNSNALTGIDLNGGDYTMQAIADPDDGSKFALELTRVTATGIASEAFIDLTGLGDAQNVIVSVDAQETVGTASQVTLQNSRGFTTDETINLDASLITRTFPANLTTSAAATLRVRGLSAGNTGDIVILRNLVITLAP